VWALSGSSERSNMRGTSRVATAVAVGLLGLVAVHFRAPADVRGDLGLPALFGLTSVLALGAGSAKLEAALFERDGQRAVRRAAGLLVGTLLGMAAVAAVSFELVLTSVGHARLGWAYMWPIVASLLIVFASRARLAGAGALALGVRALVVVAVGLVLLLGARAGVSAKSVRAVPEPPMATQVRAPDGVVSAEPVASVVPSAEPAPSTAAPSGQPGELQIESVVPHGLLEADARGGVTRRIDKLQACLTDQANQQSGALTLKVGIDASGSVNYCRTTGGDLVGTPLADCLLRAFYKMGFAAPASGAAFFEIALRSPPRARP
jgi:hypothetical protein